MIVGRRQAAHFAAQGVIAGAYDVAVAAGVGYVWRLKIAHAAAVSAARG